MMRAVETRATTSLSLRQGGLAAIHDCTCSALSSSSPSGEAGANNENSSRQMTNNDALQPQKTLFPHHFVMPSTPNLRKGQQRKGADDLRKHTSLVCVGGATTPTTIIPASLIHMPRKARNETTLVVRCDLRYRMRPASRKKNATCRRRRSKPSASQACQKLWDGYSLAADHARAEPIHGRTRKPTALVRSQHAPQHRHTRRMLRCA